MKKLFMVMAVAFVSAVMFNACKDDTPTEPTPTPTPDPGKTYVSQWDSTYYFGEDSVWYEKNIVKERNTAENSILVYAYEWSDYKLAWKPLHVHKYFYDNQDRLSLYLGCEPESFESYEFNDSTVYTYGNQEKIEIEYFNNGHGYFRNDSTHYTLDALDCVLEKVHITYTNEGKEVSMQEKTTYTYDPETHLMQSETISRYNGTQWVNKEATTYVIKDGKHFVSYDYNYIMADTLSRSEYSYNGTTETIISYEKDMNTKVWSEVSATRKVTTYTERGDIEATISYEYDAVESNWKYTEGELRFYTLKQK